jgi:limonene-1,2-epoxide hydrolase
LDREYKNKTANADVLRTDASPAATDGSRLQVVPDNRLHNFTPPNVVADSSRVSSCSMRLLAAAALVALLLVAPASAAPKTPAQVVRAWSAALNRGDNEAAANLFAKNAVVTQNGVKLVLSTHHLAVLWNEGLPCAGHILKITVTKNIADAIFRLGERKGIKCDAPGIEARAAFKIVNGKIVYWAQLPVPKPKSAPA